VFIHAGILFHYLRRSIRLRWLLAVATALSVVFIFLTSLRRGARSTHEVMQFYQPAPILRHMVGNRNLLGAAKTAHIIDGVPEHLPYQYGRSYVVWLVTPVPRTVWPDKPAIRTGALVGEAIFNTPERTGVPPGVIGELYINFGLVGIPIGMFLVGFGLRSLYVTLRPHLKSRNGALVYLCFLTPLGYQLVASDFPGTMINLGKNIIPILAATYLLTDSRTG
ncbi:MAG: O-antigen polymerase, partial [Bradymonadaceae bacterium]